MNLRKIALGIVFAFLTGCGSGPEVCLELYQQCLIAALINAETFEDDQERFANEVQNCVAQHNECTE